jgi:HEAT repeat protein
MRQKEEALASRRQLGDHSNLARQVGTQERRQAAAEILGGLRSRDGVRALIEVLGEGRQQLSWACMHALTSIGSRRGARKLMSIVRGNYPLPARQEAVYTLWQLDETRAESLFIRLSSAVGAEEEYIRDMATEALGNTWWRPATQRAIAERLFDPSPSVRYSALCACSCMYPQPYSFPNFLRHALVAKLDDPDRVDDDRVIAKTAAELLGRK